MTAVPPAPRLLHATPARLDTWLECPRRYRFRYVDRPAPPRAGAWAHLSLGAAVHVALARWWTLPVECRAPQAVAAVVDEVWTPDGFRDREQSDRWRARARTMVADYVEAETARRTGLADPVRVEAAVALRCSPTVAVGGRPDRIDERPTGEGTELVVVDYKTGRRGVSGDDARASRTLAIYAAAAEATLRRPATRVELHHLPTGSVAVWRHDVVARDRQVARSIDVAEECRRVEAEVAAGTSPPFEPRPGPLCAWCDYRAACPEGAAAVPAAAPWAGLEPDDDAS